MHALEPHDLHCLRAAIGWNELGNPAEALAELEKISPAGTEQPEVLEVRWIVYAGHNNWPAALGVAERLWRAVPDSAAGWLHRAYATRRTPDGSVQRAWDCLLPAFEKFPDEVTIAYNLACYACQMQQLDEARVWLDRAVKIGGRKVVKRMALDDPDLEPLRDEVKKL